MLWVLNKFGVDDVFSANYYIEAGCLPTGITEPALEDVTFGGYGGEGYASTFLEGAAPGNGSTAMEIPIGVCDDDYLIYV